MTHPNSNLGAWMARLREPDPTTSLKERLDEIDRDALDNAVGFAAEHTRRYIASGGADDGWDGPRPIHILYTRGRRSGQLRRNPLLYVERDGVRHIVGSLGGADHHPQWFHNLTVEPEVYIRVGPEVLAATARPLTADERAAFWPTLVADYPMFGDYQSATTREIPVVALDPRLA